MPCNFIVCIDGTNSQFALLNTSVARFVQVLDLDPKARIFSFNPLSR